MQFYQNNCKFQFSPLRPMNKMSSLISSANSKDCGEKL